MLQPAGSQSQDAVRQPTFYHNQPNTLHYPALYPARYPAWQSRVASPRIKLSPLESTCLLCLERENMGRSLSAALREQKPNREQTRI